MKHLKLILLLVLASCNSTGSEKVSIGDFVRFDESGKLGVVKSIHRDECRVMYVDEFSNVHYIDTKCSWLEMAPDSVTTLTQDTGQLPNADSNAHYKRYNLPPDNPPAYEFGDFNDFPPGMELIVINCQGEPVWKLMRDLLPCDSILPIEKQRELR